MKFFISADIEGVTGVTDWRETHPEYPEYQWAKEQMTKEVVAACEGLNEIGATEIWVKDGHNTARNIDIHKLPENVKLIRGWSREPGHMMSGLDESFHGVLFIGYHSGAYTDYNPLSHSFSGSKVFSMKLNGEYASEFTFNAKMADYYNVPIIFLSGDKGICNEAKNHSKSIETVDVKYGKAGATFNIHPKIACERIKKGVKKGFKNIKEYKKPIEDKFIYEITFKEHMAAKKASYYPGAELIGPHTVKFVGENIIDVTRAHLFLV